MANADISHVSEEEENYLRMNLLLTSISPKAVRVLFDQEFHPSCLLSSIRKEYGKLSDLKKKHVINAAHWKLLFPRSGVPNSKDFDVTLMSALLRNLANLPPPTGGYDKLPLNTDIKATADLARIKFYRNELAHINDGKVNFTFFTTAWEEISGAVGRLGGPSMEVECIELRSKYLDQSTVPWKIRVQISQKLEEWRENDVNFVQTKAAQKVFECTQENNCVTITATSGVGKTAILQHVVLKMADSGYDVLLVTNPLDIIRFHNPNKKILFVIDDFCGIYSINQSDLHNWETVIKRIKDLIQNKVTKIIVACRLQVYNDEKFKSLSIFRTNVCNLLSDDLSLSQTEKQLIAKMYLKTEGSDIIQYSDLFDCFPLLCRLFHDNPELNITEFFRNPFFVYEAELEQLKNNGHIGKYCALALCVMFNNELEEEMLTDDIDTETRAIIENTCEACGLDKVTSRLTLLDELNSLEYTFIKKDQGVYKTVHDKLFDFLSYHFGKNMIQCLIKNAHSKFIKDRFVFEREASMNQFITIVTPEYHNLCIQRMVNDWSNGEIEHVFNNINMDNPIFRRRYLCYLNTLDISYQRRLAHTCDILNHETVLFHCCLKGDIPLVHWCLSHSVDVNMCGSDTGCPLYVSSQECHTKVVSMLLDNQADMKKCRYTGSSPLHIACKNNRIDIVQLLLENKADINKCMTDETSPLFICCQEGFKDITELLLDNKADINKCTGTGSSPLYIACQNNHIDIVKLLLDNKADIHKCSAKGLSPLCIARSKGRIEIVNLLLTHE